MTDGGSGRWVSLFGPYAALLRGPGARGLVATSMLARLSFGLFDLSVIVLVERQTGSFALAGLVIGMHAVGIGLTAPLRGRLLDRFGSGRVIAPMSVLNAVAIAALPLSAALDAVWLLVLVGFVSGASVPPLVPAMRLEWQRLLGAGTPALTHAYAFEASAQLAVFLVGPLLAAGSLALAGPQPALFASAALIAVGGPLFGARARTRPGPAEGHARGVGAIAISGVQTLVVVTAIADGALGVVDVAVVAVAVERGHPAASGVLLALFTLGSVLGALLYGSHAWRQTARQRLLVILVMFTTVLVLLSLAGPLVLFAVLLVLAGAPSAALWVTTSVALDDVTPTGQGAEAYTWLSSANAAGIALGGVIGGTVIDSRGATTAFMAAAALALLAAATLLVGRRSLARTPRSVGPPGAAPTAR